MLREETEKATVEAEYFKRELSCAKERLKTQTELVNRLTKEKEELKWKNLVFLGELKCPHCGYDGKSEYGTNTPFTDDLGVLKMNCAKCKRTFNVIRKQ